MAGDWKEGGGVSSTAEMASSLMGCRVMMVEIGS